MSGVTLPSYRDVRGIFGPAPVTVTFLVPGKPCAKQSLRFTRAGHRYQPADVVEYRSRIAIFARQAWPHAPLEGPVELDILALFAKPVSWTKRKRAAAYHHAQKPDFDNLSKAAADGIKGILFRDDAQICDARVSKRWSDNREELQITVREVVV